MMALKWKDVFHILVDKKNIYEAFEYKVSLNTEQIWTVKEKDAIGSNCGLFQLLKSNSIGFSLRLGLKTNCNISMCLSICHKLMPFPNWPELCYHWDPFTHK